MPQTTQSTGPQTIYLRDYTPPDYLIEHVTLRFELGDTHTDVRAVLNLRRQPQAAVTPPAPLVLYGQALTLTGLRLNGETLVWEQVGDSSLDAAAPQVDDKQLVIPLNADTEA